ncbi:MAG: hypothetical protein K6G80_09385, partial [Treponema sp.]|nr:hypothetical protein [Treponema sp.]
GTVCQATSLCCTLYEPTYDAKTGTVFCPARIFTKAATRAEAATDAAAVTAAHTPPGSAAITATGASAGAALDTATGAALASKAASFTDTQSAGAAPDTATVAAFTEGTLTLARTIDGLSKTDALASKSGTRTEAVSDRMTQEKAPSLFPLTLPVCRIAEADVTESDGSIHWQVTESRWIKSTQRPTASQQHHAALP